MNQFLVCEYTKTGLSHIGDNGVMNPCEDAVSSLSDRTGRVKVITLSDGCGRVSHAREGACIASSIAADIVSSEFDELCEMTPQEREEVILLEVRRALFREALRLNADISEFSCTLLIAALRDDGKGMIFHIGDGLIYARSTDGSIRLLSKYKHKYSNVTSFVTSVRTNCKTEVLENISGFFLSSDGAEPFLMKNNNYYADLLVKLSHILPQDRMYSELKAYTVRLTENGMFDDASYITVSENKYVTDVFTELFCRKNSSEWLKKALFGGIDKNTLKKYAEIIVRISESANGADLRSLTDIMHTHTPVRTLKRIAPLVRQGIIIKDNGRFYLNR